MFRRLASATAAVFAASLVLTATPVAQAASTVGSFEIDGNLVDPTPAAEPLDWSSLPAANLLPPFTDGTGKNDDAFGNGSKELEPGMWSCINQSAPGKDDIRAGQIAFRTIGGKQFVYVNYTRKAVNGDAHMDYEFSQSATPNPKCPALPLRTDGDIVVTFDTENGGADIFVRAFKWAFTGPGVGTFTELPLGSKGDKFDGAVNIPNTIDQHTAGDFGEAALNLTDTIGTFQCSQFAKVYMKSRSSTSITAALQDRTAAQRVKLANCPISGVQKLVRNVSANPDPNAPYAATGTATAGQTLEYKITYSNTGDAAATGVTLTDTLGSRQTLLTACVAPACTQVGNVLTFNVGTVAAGASTSVIFRTRLDAVFPSGTTHVLNSVVADSAEEAPTPPSSTDVTVTAAAVLSSAKTVSPTSQDVDKTVTYTVTVSNTGAANGTTTVVDDYDQAHITVSNISNGGVDNGNTITWTNLPVAANSQVALTYTGTVKGTYSGAPGTHCTTGQYPVVNTVTITGGTGSNATLCVNASPILTTDKTVSPTSTTATGVVTYSVKISNTGTADATTTVVDDYDQTHITVSNISGGGANNSTLGTITWTNVAVPAGQSVTFTYTGTVKGTFSGPPGPNCTTGQFPVINQVTITGGSGDTNTLCVTASPNLSSTKTVSSATAPVGGSVGYTITVINSGAAEGTTTVTDDYDQAHLTISNISNGGVDNGDTITWTGVVVPGGQSVQRTYTATVKGTYSGPSTGCQPGQYPVLNSVTITGGTGANAKLCVIAAPVLSSDKTVDPTSASSGQTVNYSIKVSNTGSAAGTTTVVDDYDQAHLTISDISNSGVDNGDTITWTNVAVPAKDFVTLTYKATVKGTFNGGPGPNCTTGQYPVINTVTITGGTGDTNTLCVNASPVLTTDKTVSSSTADPGDTVTYTITVTNSGNADATTTIVDDYDQAHLVISNISNGGVNNNDTITWTNVPVAAGQAVARTYDATVTGPFTGIPPAGCDPGRYPVINLVTITGGTGDTNTLCVNTGTTLTVSKTACPTTAVPGGYLTYTITYNNTGPNPASNATLVDTIPGSTQVANAGGGQVSGNQVTWSLGTVPVGGGGSKTLVLLVSAPDGSQLSNHVEVGADNAVTTPFDLVTNVSNAGATTSGSAYALDIDLLGVALVDELAPAGSVAPGSPAADASQPVPDVALPGIALLKVLPDTSVSEVTDKATTTATSEVLALNLLTGAITADAVKGVSQSVATPFDASGNSTGTTFANLRINGSPVANVAPNTSLTVKNPLLPTQNLANVVLYEETKSASFANNKFTATHSLNMIHITLLKPFLTLPKGAEIIVGHTQSTATYPSGLACGTAPATVSGDSFAAYVQGKVLGVDVVTSQVGDAYITPLGGTDSDVIAGVLLSPAATSGTATDTASGSINPNANSTARSRVEGASLLDGLITATLLDVSSSSTANGTTASTAFSATFVNLVIAGTPIALPVAPNTTIAIPQPGGDVVLVILNEQILGGNGVHDTDGTINAVHVYVLKASGVVEAEVIVAHAHSDAHK